MQINDLWFEEELVRRLKVDTAMQAVLSPTHFACERWFVVQVRRYKKGVIWISGDLMKAGSFYGDILMHHLRKHGAAGTIAEIKEAGCITPQANEYNKK